MSTPLTHRFVASGFVGAVMATILGAEISPDHPLAAVSAFARATVYLLMVFATAATATFTGFLVNGERRTTQARQIAVRTAATTLWLPPLLLYSAQRSWFVCVLWAVLLVEIAHLIAFLRTTLHDHALSQMSPDGPFSVLKQDFPSGISILAALMIQSAIFSSVAGHDIVAGLLYFAGTSAIAYRTLHMFQDLPALSDRDFRPRIVAALISATFLIVFAWLPYIAGARGSGSGGDSTAAQRGGRSTQANGAHAPKVENAREKQVGQATPRALARLRALFASDSSDSHGNSFAIAKRILDSTFPQQSDGQGTRVQSRQKTNVSTAVLMVGPVFPGIKLYPEAEPHTRLAAPPPLSATTAFGAARSDPLSIPFDGVYWFWRGPSDRPPSNSIVMHGSPAARFFRSTDGDGMSMEAQQNLGFMVDPKRYGAIELFIENADPFPNTVNILLKIRDTSVPGQPLLSLGMEAVSAPAPPAATGAPATQMLRFRIPSTIAIGSFDELTVSYYLKGPRSDRSARIAIERFRLVPRGG